jgi:hypothetical protein
MPYRIQIAEMEIVERPLCDQNENTLDKESK